VQINLRIIFVEWGLVRDRLWGFAWTGRRT
jgi:hypothetical protein